MERFYYCNKEENDTRCFCQQFIVNSTDSSRCECGHSSCFHSPEPRSRALSLQGFVGRGTANTSVQEELNALRSGGPLRRVQQSYARGSPITPRARPTTNRNILSPPTMVPQPQLPAPGSSLLRNVFTARPNGSTVAASSTAIISARRLSVTDESRVDDMEDLDSTKLLQVFFMKEIDASSVPAVTWATKSVLIYFFTDLRVCC